MKDDVAQWTPGAKELIDWFLDTDPPAEGFALQSGVFVQNPANYWAYLKMNIGEGPQCARAGALILDLEKLRKVME